MISEKYNDVEIVYSEGSNAWTFELGGRERSVKSLREAKDAIDATPKPKKAVVRFEAYLAAWGGLKIVTVGAASHDYKGRPQFWVSDNGDRSKQQASALLKINEFNSPIYNEVMSLTERITAMGKEREEKIASMERLDIPAEE